MRTVGHCGGHCHALVAGKVVVALAGGAGGSVQVGQTVQDSARALLALASSVKVVPVGTG